MPTHSLPAGITACNPALPFCSNPCTLACSACLTAAMATRKRGWGSAADAYKCGACGEFYVPKWDFIGAIVNRVGVSVRE